jgi:hypothetical protein
MRASPVAKETNAPHEIAICNAGRDERNVIVFDEIAHHENLVDVIKAHLFGSADLVVVARLEPPHKVTAQAAQSSGGEDSFGRAACSHSDVNAGSLNRGGNGSIDVAVGDKFYFCTGGSDIVDQFLVPWPV